MHIAMSQLWRRAGWSTAPSLFIRYYYLSHQSVTGVSVLVPLMPLDICYTSSFMAKVLIIIYFLLLNVVVMLYNRICYSCLWFDAFR